MNKITEYHENKKVRELLSVTLIVLLFALEACTSGKRTGSDDKESKISNENFHADNDIAMTVRSLADAIKVGEPLDSTEYDFEGILTDGQGSPLYTDVQGAPGRWLIEVIDSSSVSIRNIYLGDLLPGELETYILQSLRIDENVKMDLELGEDDDTRISVYEFRGGFLRFETRSATAPNGLEGPLLTIILTANPPTTAETQTSA